MSAALKPQGGIVKRQSAAEREAARKALENVWIAEQKQKEADAQKSGVALPSGRALSRALVKGVVTELPLQLREDIETATKRDTDRLVEAERQKPALLSPGSAKYAKYGQRRKSDTLPWEVLLSAHDNACFYDQYVRIRATTSTKTGQPKYTMTIYDLPGAFPKYLEACKYRFVVLHVSVVHSKGMSVGMHDSHANALVIDKEDKVVEWFDPWGAERAISRKTFVPLLKTLWEFFEPLGYEVVPTELECPIVGPQTIQTLAQRGIEGVEGGTCLPWTYWYIHHRLTYPNVPRQQLLAVLLDSMARDDRPFYDFIKQFNKALIKPKSGEDLAEATVPLVPRLRNVNAPFRWTRWTGEPQPSFGRRSAPVKRPTKVASKPRGTRTSDW